MRINWIIFTTTLTLIAYFIATAVAMVDSELPAKTVTWEQPLVFAIVISVAFWGGFFSHEKKEKRP
jgi:hypothetical protein